jgi:aminoglycoside 3-N-acetyltransferase
MRAVSAKEVLSALKTLGITHGDGLLVHSAIQFLGRPEGGVGMYYEALCTALNDGPEKQSDFQRLTGGTIAVPTFNFEFARGEPYDPDATPSKGMGVFSEYVRQLPEARRTAHPMQSLAVVGQYADDLAGRDTPSAFDPGSAFDRMLELGWKLLLLGADVQAVSMLHYSEQRANVPYRYWKEFSGRVKTPQGWKTGLYRMFVRDLDLDPQIELYPVQKVMQERGMWHRVHLNYGQLSLCRLNDFISVLDGFLVQDPWSLVTNPPVDR